MKKIPFLIITFFCVTSINAQTWDSLSSGTNGLIDALTVYNNNLYAGGSFGQIGTISTGDIAEWNGSSWDSLESGIYNNQLFITRVNCLCEYNGNLFAGGENIGSAGGVGVRGIAKWNGSNWDSVQGGLTGCTTVNALVVYNGELYAGGAFKYAQYPMSVNNIAKWNGVSWDSVGYGIDSGGTILSMAVYDGNLYVAGSFNSAGGKPANNIALWNGVSWSTALAGGVNGYIFSLTVYNGNLYAGGTFDSAGGTPAKNIAEWNGTNWSSVGGGIIGSGVYTLSQYGSILCAGGRFDSASNKLVYNIAYWNGLNWNAFSTGIGGDVFSMTSYNGTLFVGGHFDSAGGVCANSIAQFKSPLGINDLANNNESVNIYPNPNNGIFTISLSHASLASASRLIIEVYNVLGEKVIVATLKPMKQVQGGQVQGNNLINLTGQPSGVYFYRVLQENGNLIGSGKVVVEKP